MKNEEDLTKYRRGGGGRAEQRGWESDVTKSATIRVSQAWDFLEVHGYDWTPGKCFQRRGHGFSPWSGN